MVMKTAITVRLDPDLLEAIRQQARQENRTLTNLIETVLRDRIAPTTAAIPARGGAASGSGRLRQAS
jgi:hypothetical protein